MGRRRGVAANRVAAMSASRSIRCSICAAERGRACTGPTGRPLAVDHPQREVEARTEAAAALPGEVAAMNGQEKKP